MASDAPMEIASAIQSASINRHASVRHDLNPSTAASKKEPVTLSSSPAQSDVAEDEIPLSALHPVPRRNTMPPLPDLRFEQSYLKSIESATSWQSILWITFRDQVALAFIQGAVWTLVLSGWRHWNRSSQFSGRSVGSRIRRWWWGVNNWTVPEGKGLRNQGPAKDVQGVRRSFMKV
ncbi:DUF1770-domain-containing protein [Lepidopterella palustris CBS 459.81]|uniref:DUF1770-domain-containing protein n=1 Tax=Lepidopterella palustris CBS 459.81 TaxID=1314670 RepID=A0A8E2JJJ7_9PEZI|nr:DUF1770-domain-containing protein [Lepidopterella palustris CBS 459.81]